MPAFQVHIQDRNKPQEWTPTFWGDPNRTIYPASIPAEVVRLTLAQAKQGVSDARVNSPTRRFAIVRVEG
jgi:hypothetical protein